jgi:hypothetical protein
MKTKFLFVVLLYLTLHGAQGQNAATNSDPQAAYTATITQRAEKTVATLALPDAGKAQRVRDLLVQQYRDLNAIHEKLKDKSKMAPTPQPGASTIAGATEADLKKLHAEFLSKLSRELTPEQVDKVKDGMTYGVVQVTYKAYLAMLPELKEQEKAHILSLLVEAREIAMDAGSAEEKHQWFGKYKGKINNYLSAQGYDLKKASKNLEMQKQ